MTIARRKKRLFLSLSTVLLLAGGYITYALLLPIPSLNIEQTTRLTAPAETISLPWPSKGAAAVGLVGSTVIVSSGASQKLPTASTAKLMTALAVLDKKPLAPGQEGPLVPITQADVANYQSYVAHDGSNIPVVAGEQLTEYQALQALLLPSANNIADTLAVWAFGSIENYTQYANKKSAALDMHDSYFSDASGFSAATVSTPSDLVKLGKATLGAAVLREIAAQPTATLPVAGTVHNVNYLLGTDSIDGLKTGNSDEAGGCFVFTATITPAGATQTVRMVGAIMNAPYLSTAIDASLPLIEAMPQTFAAVTPIQTGNQLASYETPWGESTAITAPRNLSLLRWKPEGINTEVTTRIKFAAANNYQQVATAKASSSLGQQSLDLDFSQTITPPSLWWRLTHPWR